MDDDWDIRVSPPEPVDAAVPSRAAVLAKRARRGVIVLRIAAGLIVLIGIVGQIAFMQTDEMYGPDDTPFSYDLYQFLSSMVWPLSFGALTLAASIAIDVMVARLILESGEEPSAAGKPTDAAGDLIVNAPPRPMIPHGGYAQATAADDSIWRPREPVE